jgi:RNA-dependent RNA polymerase
MEFDIQFIDPKADKYEVTKVLAEVLHSEEFFESPDDPKARPMNFEVVLEEATVLGTLHSGRGKLRIPTGEEGSHFFRVRARRP